MALKPGGLCSEAHDMSVRAETAELRGAGTRRVPALICLCALPYRKAPGFLLSYSCRKLEGFHRGRAYVEMPMPLAKSSGEEEMILLAIIGAVVLVAVILLIL